MGRIVGIEHNSPGASTDIGRTPFFPFDIRWTGTVTVPQTLRILVCIPQPVEGNLACLRITGYEILLPLSALWGSDHTADFLTGRKRIYSAFSQVTVVYPGHIVSGTV